MFSICSNLNVLLECASCHFSQFQIGFASRAVAWNAITTECEWRAALLARNTSGGWSVRDLNEVDRRLSDLYEISVTIAGKRSGLATVARDLSNGDIAKAQIAALLIRFPDPETEKRPGESLVSKRLAADLFASGLLKMDDDWEEQHPRTGTQPNPG